MDLLPFDQIHFDEPDISALATATSGWVAQIQAAAGPQAVVDAVRAWDQAGRKVEGWAAWTGICFARDTQDPRAVARHDRYNVLAPRLETLSARVKRAVMDSPHLPGLRQALGEHLLALWQLDLDSHDEALQEDQVQEQRLASQYGSLCSAARISFRGHELGLPGLGVFMEDPDRQTRHDAASALWDWFGQNGEQIDHIFDELVSLRDGMARRLGDSNHIAMGYRRMRRRGYGPADVAVFRQVIQTQVVPLVSKLRQQQATRLGLDHLMVWDLRLLDPCGNPRPQGGVDWQIARAGALFGRLGLGDFFTMVRDRGLLDLVPRQGKRVGGFCSYIVGADAPFVFANMTGTAGDTRVFTHELGHALQVWSSRDVPMTDLLWPSADAAEVHSMSLEYLSWPHMELFYGEHADRYRRDHLTGALTLLPWLAALDDFQHRVYTDPGADRDQIWRTVEALYMPEVDWGDIEHGAAGRRWQSVPHLFDMAFYMIDYGLALCCALQLWLLSRRDPADAMARYLALCHTGGRAPFLELVAAAGLRSPFDPGVLADVLAEAQTVLDNMNVPRCGT